MVPSEGGEARGVRPPAAEPPSVGPLMPATAAGRDSKADEGDRTLDDAAAGSKECEYEDEYWHCRLGTQGCGADESSLAESGDFDDAEVSGGASDEVSRCYHHAVLAEARKQGCEDRVGELLEQRRRAMSAEDYERAMAINALIRDALVWKPRGNRRRRRS